MTQVKTFLVAAIATLGTFAAVQAQDSTMVTVTIENIAPDNGVVLTPAWVGFHSGSFDSYNGGLTSLKGLERLAEDGDNSLISEQFLDFNESTGGYTYIDNSNPEAPQSRLVRTGDLTDRFRQDATLPSESGPIRPGQTATGTFVLRTDGSNDFFSYASMVLPTNDFFIANGSPVAHDISEILSGGGEVSFFIGTPNSGTNDAGTEREDFRFSAGNPLFEGRNLPAGQSRPNQGRSTRDPIANVTGDAFAAFQLVSFRDRVRVLLFKKFVLRTILILKKFGLAEVNASFIDRLEQRLEDFATSVIIDVDGFDFNQYEDGIARVTITAVPVEEDGFAVAVGNAEVADDAVFVEAADAGNLYFNIHTAQFPAGEIRGQIDEVVSDKTVGGTRVLTLAASLDSAQEPDDASDSAATGEATVKIIVDPEGNATYSVDLVVDGIAIEDLIPVAVFSAIHVHNAPRGVNGGVVQDVIVDAGGSPDDFSVLVDL